MDSIYPGEETTDVEPRIMPNRNTDWTRTRSFWLFYVFLIIFIQIFFQFLGFSPQNAWTITNVIHFLVTFVLFHWLKGAPIHGWDYQGKFDKLTFWEQIDYQLQFTPTRKFLIIVPIMIFFVATYYVESSVTFFVNFMVSILCLIPKLPALHKVRLFNINSE